MVLDVRYVGFSAGPSVLSAAVSVVAGVSVPSGAGVSSGVGAAAEIDDAASSVAGAAVVAAAAAVPVFGLRQSAPGYPASSAVLRRSHSAARRR